MGCGHLKHKKHSYTITNDEGSFNYKIEEVTCADCGEYLGTRKTRLRYVAVSWKEGTHWFDNPDKAMQFKTDHPSVSVFEVENHE